MLIQNDLYLVYISRDIPFRNIICAGDQDWMTTLAWEFPQLFHILPCSYNFQLLQTRQQSTCKMGYKILHGLLPGENV